MRTSQVIIVSLNPNIRLTSHSVDGRPGSVPDAGCPRVQAADDLRRKLLTELESVSRHQPSLSLLGWLQHADRHCRLSPARYWPLIGRAVLISASDWLFVSITLTGPHIHWEPPAGRYRAQRVSEDNIQLVDTQNMLNMNIQYTIMKKEYYFTDHLVIFLD